MLYKEDIEQSLRKTVDSLMVGGDTIRALTELYNSLPSSEMSLPVTLDNEPAGENDSLTYKSTKQELQDLADELNKVEPINWNNEKQVKYYITFDTIDKTLGLSYIYRLKGLDIYSTDKSFLEVAKERIGEEKLIELFKEGV